MITDTTMTENEELAFLNEIINTSEMLTIEQYRFIKSKLVYYSQCKVFDKHIGREFRQKMGQSQVSGSKYKLYCTYYRVYNSKLAKALK